MQTALTDPRTLDFPVASWTLDRLVSYLKEKKGLQMKRSRLGELLLAEGLRWRKQEHWFGERVDPDFAENRGLSQPSPPSRQQAASSSECGNGERFDDLDLPPQDHLGPGTEGTSVVAISPDQLETGSTSFNGSHKVRPPS